jgi:GT2 family glycosyltransferase
MRSMFKPTIPRVSVVIVTYRSRLTIADTLKPLQQAAVENQLECIVVDNASGDGTADFIALHYPWVRLVRSRENLGFGRGCNAGFAAASADYVLFLNPDATIEFAAMQACKHWLRFLRLIREPLRSARQRSSGAYLQRAQREQFRSTDTAHCRWRECC